MEYIGKYTKFYFFYLAMKNVLFNFKSYFQEVLNSVDDFAISC